MTEAGINTNNTQPEELMCLLSIVVPNYNYGCFAEDFWTSIVNQSLNLAQVEILFVDDGSSDDSVEQALKWLNKIKCHKFKIIETEHLGKPGLVRNLGLSQACGDLLICLDPDDIYYPFFLERCVNYLLENKTVDLVYTDYDELHGNVSAAVTLPEFSPALLRTQNPISPPAMYRRRLLELKVSYRKNTAYEDWDYWIQCKMAGAEFSHIDEVLYGYRVHDSNFSSNAVKDDGPSKARIVLNNSTFFSAEVCQWAQDHLRGRLYAPAFRRGYIPTPADIREVAKLF